jgi:hypothetical protein
MKSSARERSLWALQQRWQQHANCPGQARRHGQAWGVYCKTHNKWIQWVRHEHLHCFLDEEIDAHEPNLDPDWIKWC